MNRAEGQWRFGPHLVLVLLAAAVLPRCGRSETGASSSLPPIEIKATLRPARSVTVTSEIDGRVESVSVREGMVVTENGILAEIANPAVERDAAVAAAQLEWLDLRLRRGGRTPSAGPARNAGAMEITGRILALRRDRLEKMKALRRSGDVTARDLEQAEIEYLAALRDFNNERRVSPGSPAIDDAALLRIEREKAAAEQRFAQQRRALLQVRSPIGGTVVRLHVEKGQSMLPRHPIADVADLSVFHVFGDFDPALLRYVRSGARVDVKILSVPARTFSEEIDHVIPIQGSGTDARRPTVVVAIPNPDGSLQPNTEALITLRSLQ
jgi:multidrug resistance efflux pump